MLAISIVPRLPPEIDGVGRLCPQSSSATTPRLRHRNAFYCLHPTWAGATEIEDFRLTK